MVFKDIVIELNRCLEKSGFDFNFPDPKLAWQAFKIFARFPVDTDEFKSDSSESIGVSFSHFADRDDELWMSFSRSINLVGNDGEIAATTAVGCDLSSIVPAKLSGIDKKSSSSRFINFDEFCDAIENWPEFQLCMNLRHWKWEESRWYWQTDTADEN